MAIVNSFNNLLKLLPSFILLQPPLWLTRSILHQTTPLCILHHKKKLIVDKQVLLKVNNMRVLQRRQNVYFVLDLSNLRYAPKLTPIHHFDGDNLAAFLATDFCDTHQAACAATDHLA